MHHDTQRNEQKGRERQNTEENRCRETQRRARPVLLTREEEECETWKDVVGYEGLYKVSDMGRIMSLERKVNGGNGLRIHKGRFLKPQVKRLGYLAVLLSRHNKTKNKSIHRMVVESFIGTPSTERRCVNHKNGNVADNRLPNLEWCSNSENMLHAYRVINRKIYRGGECKTSKRIVGTCLETGEEVEFPSISSVIERGFVRASVTSVLIGRRASLKGWAWRYCGQVRG